MEIENGPIFWKWKYDKWKCMWSFQEWCNGGKMFARFEITLVFKKKKKQNPENEDNEKKKKDYMLKKQFGSQMVKDIYFQLFCVWIITNM